MDEESALPRRERWLVVAVVLLAGLILYAAARGQAKHWPLLGNISVRVYGYTLTLGLASWIALSLERVEERRWWGWLAGVAATLALLASWAAWSVRGAPDLVPQPVLAPYALSVAWGLFAALPFAQAQLRGRRLGAAYSVLFEAAWQNGLSLLLAAFFVGICWLVLMLWQALFGLIGIQVFKRWFGEQAFAYLATALMAGLGILIGRTQQAAVRMVRQIVFAICKGLLPLLAFVAVLFVLSLPFTGLDGLWRTRMAARILLGLQLLMVLLVNAVHQGEAAARPYPRALDGLVRAGLLCLPVYAALTLYALGLRVAQYGWTAERVWMVLLAALLAGYALAYALAACRRRSPWLHGLGQGNIVLAAIGIALVAAADSPLLDPHRIAVRSQLARWQRGEVPAARMDLNYLRFESGRIGYRALEGLRGDARLREAAQVMLARSSLRSAAVPSSPRWDSEQALREHLKPAPGAEPVDQAYFDAVFQGRLPDAGCLRQDGDCVLLTPDLHGDGTHQRLLCNLAEGSLPCTLAARGADGRWQAAGQVVWNPASASATRQLLRNGQLQIERPAWPDLKTGSERASIQPAARP